MNVTIIVTIVVIIVFAVVAFFHASLHYAEGYSWPLLGVTDLLLCTIVVSLMGAAVHRWLYPSDALTWASLALVGVAVFLLFRLRNNRKLFE